MPSSIWAAVVAILAASLLGSASVAQQRATRTVATFGPGDPRFVGALVRRPWWWAGTAASIAGLALQVVALSLGPVILVQSTMTTSIVAATLAEWAILHRRPSSGTWWGMVLTILGLVGLLGALTPTAGTATGVPSAASTLAVTGSCALGLAAVTLGARRARGPVRSLGLALGTGLGYGVTALLLKIVTVQLAVGWLEPLAHPALYGAVLLGPFSILLSQNALQAGRLVTAVVSLILIMDPLVGMVGGLSWFGETVTLTPTSLAVALVSGLLLVTGIVAIQRPPRDDPEEVVNGAQYRLSSATPAPISSRRARDRRGRGLRRPRPSPGT